MKNKNEKKNEKLQFIFHIKITNSLLYKLKKITCNMHIIYPYIYRTEYLFTITITTPSEYFKKFRKCY